MKTVTATIAPSVRCAVVLDSSGPGELVEAVILGLEKEGFLTDMIRAPLPEPNQPYDIVLLRGRSDEIFNWALRQIARGSRVVPNPDMMKVIKDRWASRSVLVAAGLRLPEARFGTAGEFARGAISDFLPCVLKHRLLHGREVAVLRNQRAIDIAVTAMSKTTEFVAERYVFGEHFTTYFVEDRYFCFPKDPFTHSVSTEEPISCPVEEMIVPTRRYREAMGLYFGKLDLVVEEQSSTVYVVDAGVSANVWPVPNAVDLLSVMFRNLADEVRLR